MTRRSAHSADALAVALRSEAVITRYRAKQVVVPGSACVWWTGAIAGRGHGRFWLGSSDTGAPVTVIAHRFAWGLAHGVDAALSADVLGHTCDNPLCQNADHLRAGDNAVNRAEWAARRHQLAGPLRDQRGTRGRCLELRAALRGGAALTQAVAVGVSPVEHGQMGLW